MLGGGRLRDVYGFLQSSSQVDGSILNHLPDVFDPVLLVLNARRLPLAREKGSKVNSQNDPGEFGNLPWTRSPWPSAGGED